MQEPHRFKVIGSLRSPFLRFSVSSEGHDLPLAIRLDPGNASDFTASLLTFERLRKDLRATLPELAITTFIADSGHDSEPVYRFLLDRGAAPVIPLKGPALAVHPQRPDVTLSPRGVPTCQAQVEMTSWGSAGPERKVFVCPVKAGKLDACPLAPADHPAWRCQPGTRLGPVVVIKVDDNPRLCPPVPRNSPGYQPLMNLRSGCERSNSVKKETFQLEAARHRRSSFWLIRLHLIALLQHARAWVARASPAALIADLLGRPQAQVAWTITNRLRPARRSAPCWAARLPDGIPDARLKAPCRPQAPCLDRHDAAQMRSTPTYRH